MAVEELVQRNSVVRLKFVSDDFVQAQDALADDPGVGMHRARGERGPEQLANRGMVDGICSREDIAPGDVSVEASFQECSAFARAGAVDLTQGFDGVGGGLTGGKSDDVAWSVRLSPSVTDK